MYQTLIIKDANSQVRFTHTEPAYQAFSIELLGTLRSDNGEANGDVAEKPYFFAFKRFLPCTKSLSYLKVGKLSWS